MAKQQPPELRKLLQLIQRIIVLTVAAYGLWIEMPYESLLLRTALLWGILSISTSLIEVAFQYFGMKAKVVVYREQK
jgi:hypothetical protein